mmetsp:Transcript_14470/g.25469  ORF Transcript_14470/g.25469 Transcript_14470/m.25469 type:complete len:200 (+) Transcript_14470:799-1398(+)
MKLAKFSAVITTTMYGACLRAEAYSEFLYFSSGPVRRRIGSLFKSFETIFKKRTSSMRATHSTCLIKTTGRPDASRSRLDFTGFHLLQSTPIVNFLQRVAPLTRCTPVPTLILSRVFIQTSTSWVVSIRTNDEGNAWLHSSNFVAAFPNLNKSQTNTPNETVTFCTKLASCLHHHDSPPLLSTVWNMTPFIKCLCFFKN